MKAKKEHEYQVMKTKKDEELKHMKDIEGIQKKNLKLTEKVRELKNLSKMNEMLMHNVSRLPGQITVVVDGSGARIFQE